MEGVLENVFHTLLLNLSVNYAMLLVPGKRRIMATINRTVLVVNVTSVICMDTGIVTACSSSPRSFLQSRADYQLTLAVLRRSGIAIARGLRVAFQWRE
jgi:hypothetical protein